MTSGNNSNAENITADAVIIGSGGGLSAAVTMAEAGVKNIVLLEKENVLGGYTRQANGLMACESPVQKRRNINVTRDEVFLKFVNWSHWHRIDPRVIRAYIDKTGDTIRWLEEKGVEFEVMSSDPGRPELLPLMHMPVGMGAAVQLALIKSCRELGVKTLLNTSGRKILTDKKGNIAGVLAVNDDGDEFRIDTRSVIIATGGFGDNKELLRQYCPDYYDSMPVDHFPHHAAHSGDGLIMAREIGAAIADSVPIYHLGPYYPKYLYPWQPLPSIAMNFYTIWVNKRGRRFIDEAGYGGMVVGNAILKQPDRVMYSVFDDRIRRDVQEGRGNFTVKPRKQAGRGGGTVEVEPEKGIPGLDEELRKQDAGGGAKIAGSWEEIAGWIGARPEVLAAEIEEYNSCCKRGYDAVFNKNDKYLQPLREPPYYAMKCYARVGETLGGIIVNEHMEVLDNRGEIIPGVYVAGVLADGIQGQTYCMDVGGSAMGFAVNSGRIAGESAARYLMEK